MLSSIDEASAHPLPSAPPATLAEVQVVLGQGSETRAQWPSVADFAGVDSLHPADYRADLEADEEPAAISRFDSFYPRPATLSPRYEPPPLPSTEEQQAPTTELPTIHNSATPAASRQSSAFGGPGEATPFLGVVSAATTGGPPISPSRTSIGISPGSSRNNNYGSVTIADLDGRPSAKPLPSPAGQQQLPLPPPLPEPQPRPWFGYMMALSAIAGFGVSMYISGGFAPLDVNPLFGPTPAALVKSGAKVTALIIPPSNQWWRLVTPLWLHAGIIHLLANGHMLYKMGFELERGIGSVKFATLYLLSSIFSMSASAIFSVPTVTVGASGALFGVLGAILAELCCNQHLLTPKEKCKHFCGIGLTIALNLAVGIFPLVDNFAHLGGLLAGILLGSVLIMHRDPRRGNKLKFRQVCMGTFSALLFIVLQGLMIACLYLKYDANVFCPWCKYISCVPTGAWQCYYNQTP